MMTIGSAVLLADIGLAGSGYPSLITKRPLFLWIIGGVSCLLMVFGILLDPFRGRTEFTPMSAACTLALNQDGASRWMLSKALPTNVKGA